MLRSRGPALWNRFHGPLPATYARFHSLSMEALPRWGEGPGRGRSSGAPGFQAAGASALLTARVNHKVDSSTPDTVTTAVMAVFDST